MNGLFSRFSCKPENQSALLRKHAAPHKHVALLVMRPIESDVRARRTFHTLIQQEYRVTLIDVTERAFSFHPIRSIFSRLRSRSQRRGTAQVCHLVMPPWRAIRRRYPWLFLGETLLLFLRAFFLLIFSRADIYHACDIAALPVCFMAAVLRRRPLVFEAYELPLHTAVIRAQGRLQRREQFLLSLVLSRMLSRCAAVIAVSPPIIDHLKTHYLLNDIVLLRNMPFYQRASRSNLLRHRLGLRATTRIALYQGYLQEDRGLALLVHAAAFLAPDIVIVLLGQADDLVRSELELLIATIGVSDRIIIMSPVAYASLLAWTASADLGLLLTPLDGTLNMRYSLPNKFFEYMMAGLPVLTTPLPAVGSLVQQYDVGQVLSMLTPEFVGSTISAMLNNPRALAHWRSRTLKAAQICCWEREQTRLAALYHTLCLNNHI